MIIKFNCHSSFGVDGKHYLLKFISRQARILSSSFKSEAWITNERVVRGQHYKANPLFIILTRQFARNIPADSVRLLEEVEPLSAVSLMTASQRRDAPGGGGRGFARDAPPHQGHPYSSFLTPNPVLGFHRGRKAQTSLFALHSGKAQGVMDSLRVHCATSLALLSLRSPSQQKLGVIYAFVVAVLQF